MSAEGTAFQVVNDSATSAVHPQGEGTAGKALATFSAGPVGYALAAPAWPGPTVGNVGTLLVFLGIPPEARAANDPVRAEAHTGTGAPTSTVDAGSAKLTAKADDHGAAASSITGGAGQAGVFTTGPQAVEASTTVGDAGVEAEATSQVSDVDVGGVIHIGSVTATARAAHNGRSGEAAGDTVVVGLTVAGQPATLDRSGLHIGSQSEPLNAALGAAANQVLRQAGFTLSIAEPARVVNGNTASFTAGSVLVTQDGGGQVTTFAIGGARATLAVGSADLPGGAGGTSGPGVDPVTSPPGVAGGSGSANVSGVSSVGSAGGVPSSAPASSPVGSSSSLPPTGGGAGRTATPGSTLGRRQPIASVLPAGPYQLPLLAVFASLVAMALAGRWWAGWLDGSGTPEEACLIEARRSNRNLGRTQRNSHESDQVSSGLGTQP